MMDKTAKASAKHVVMGFVLIMMIYVPVDVVTMVSAVNARMNAVQERLVAFLKVVLYNAWSRMVFGPFLQR